MSSNNNLTKIREMKTSIKTKLASLTINPNSLDDLDGVSNDRVMLREKLAILDTAENVERDRLVAEEKKQNGKKRRVALVALAEKSEKLVAEHTELTEHAINLISDLVSVIIKRERVFSKESTGLNDPIYSELFSAEEYSDLTHEMRRSSLGVYSGNFGKTYELAVFEQCKDDKVLKERLLALITRANELHTPMKGANSNLTKYAKFLQFKPVPDPVTETVEIVEPKKPGNHYIADMNDNSPIIEL